MLKLIFCPLDPDPGNQNLADPMDPDPKHYDYRMCSSVVLDWSHEYLVHSPTKI